MASRTPSYSGLGKGSGLTEISKKEEITKEKVAYKNPNPNPPSNGKPYA